jgi:hypothetical protein|tara:strand:+ start:22641 stop:22892 length:252 start_codon:yes stop_codon:yes gene_type:complete
MFAAAIGIDGTVKGNVGGLVAGDRGFWAFQGHLCPKLPKVTRIALRIFGVEEVAVSVPLYAVEALAEPVRDGTATGGERGGRG